MVKCESQYWVFIKAMVLGIIIFGQACESDYHNSRLDVPIPFQKGDICELCRMQTSDFRFSAEILLRNGKALKFDDAICLVQYFDMAKKLDLSDRRKVAAYYFGDYDTGRLIRSDSAIFVRSASFAGVMGKLGSAIAFADSSKAREFIKSHGGRFISFKDLWTYMGVADTSMHVFISKSGLTPNEIHVPYDKITELRFRAADEGVYSLEITGFDFDGAVHGIRKGFFQTARVRGSAHGEKHDIFCPALHRVVGQLVVD